MKSPPILEPIFLVVGLECSVGVMIWILTHGQVLVSWKKPGLWFLTRGFIQPISVIGNLLVVFSFGGLQAICVKRSSPSKFEVHTPAPALWWFLHQGEKRV